MQLPALIALLACIAPCVCLCPEPPEEKPTIEQVSSCTLPLNLRFHTVKWINDSLYVTGNELPNTTPCNGRYGQFTYKINPNTCQIQNTTTLPYNTSHHDTAVLGNKLLTIGGLVGNSSNQCFSSPWGQTVDLTTNAVAYNSLLNPGVHDTEVIPLADGNALTMGGWDWNTTSGQAVVVSPALSKLRTINLQVPRSYRTAHQLSTGQVMVLGGLYYNGTTLNNLSHIELIDPTNGTTTAAPYTLNQARRYHSSLLINDLVYVIGGTAVNSLGRGPGLTSIERINPAYHHVDTIGSLLYPRQHMQTVHLRKASKDYIGVFGGQSDVGVAVDTPELVDVATGTTTPLAGLTWGQTDHDRISVCQGNTLFLVGGENPATLTGTNKIVKVTFDPATTCHKED